MSLDIQMADPAAVAGWDDLVGAFGDATVFHGAGWARALVEAYGYQPRYFVARESGTPVAVLPLMEVRSAITGRRGVSLPFTDACAPLARDAAAFAALNAAVLEHGRSAGWKYLEWRGEASLGPDAKPSLTYWQHAIDLVADEDKQFATLKAPVRTAVRKAIGAGVQVEVSTSIDAVRAFHALNGVTRKRHGLPPQPWKFFANLQRHVLEAEQGVVVAARFEGRPVAASVYLFHGRRAVYKYGASDAAFQHLRANDLVMWEALRWFGRQGFTELSLGKTALEHEGLRRFKQGWGARESELLYYKYDYKGGGFVRDRDDVTGWHNRVFRVLPISLSRVVGNALYRHAG